MKGSAHLRKIGLARALSKLGYCSRSQALELARAGRVRINGVMRRDPESSVHLEKDRIEVDGRIVDAQAKIYVVLNKPRGVVTTASDEKDRKTVYSCLPEGVPYLSPVGRLDKASEGLLLLTNDSEWAGRVTAPGTHLPKVYHLQIGKVADPDVLDTLQKGVTADGELLRVKEVRILRHGQRNSWLEIVLEEGRNRHIRRMFDQLGIEVLRLVRVAIGPLLLGDLPRGTARVLKNEEKLALDAAMRVKSRLGLQEVSGS